MNPPGGTATPAGAICTTCPHGTIEAIVWKHAICWDTPLVGEYGKDPRFENATVRLNEMVTSRTVQPDGTVQEVTAYLDQKTAGPDGKVTFSNLVPSADVGGTYTITAHFEGYEDVTEEYIGDSGKAKVLAGAQVAPTRSVEVRLGETFTADLVLRAKLARLTDHGKWTPGRECHRRHARSTDVRGEPLTLGSVFWLQEPDPLISRDALWIALGLATLAFVFLGLLGGGMFLVSAAAICAAFFGYLTGLIFGEGPGAAAITLAIAAFVVLLVVTALAKVFGLPSDPYGVGVLTGVWASFVFGYAPGRRDIWRDRGAYYYFISALVGGLGAGAAVGLLLLAVSSAASVVGVVLAVLAGALLGGFSGWTGFAFANEGKIKMAYGTDGYKLPYLGERYCLQGARGYWSHFDENEGFYDWSMPGVDVLAAKDGHMVAFHDDDIDSADGGANFAAVRHKDGSIARYVHLKGAGITSKDWPRDLQAAIGSTPSAWQFAGADVRPSSSLNPLHVKAGHALAPTPCACATAKTDGDSRVWVFVAGLAWAVVFFSSVLLLAKYAWYGEANGEPKQTMYVYAQGNWFSKLSGTSDSGYSFGWTSVKALEAWDEVSRGQVAPDLVQRLQTLLTPPLPADLQGNPALQRDLTTLLNQLRSGQPVDHTTLDHVKQEAEGMDQPAIKREPACTDHPYKFDWQYCECIQFGAVKQPSNTFSDIGFILLGVLGLLLPFMLWGPDQYRYVNRMTYSGKYTFMYGFVIITMGPGSMLFHISFNAFGGLGDGLSMYLFGGFLFSYAVIRLFGVMFHVSRGGEFWVFLSIFVVVVIVALAANIYLMQTLETATKTLIVMLCLVPPGVILTLISAIAYEHDWTGWKWFIASVTFFGLAFLVWGLGHDGKSLCNLSGSAPNSWLQAHAVWHVLSAAGVYCLYWFLYFEKTSTTCPDTPHLHFGVSDAPQSGLPLDVEIASESGEPAQTPYKPVKFQEPDLALLESRPWSLRKAGSKNVNLGTPPLPPDLALFRPERGEHAPSVPFEGVDEPTWIEPKFPGITADPLAPRTPPTLPPTSGPVSSAPVGTMPVSVPN